MKGRNKIILAVIFVFIVCLAFIKLTPIFQGEKRDKDYYSNQELPSKHDLNRILKYKSSYMGDASNIINLFSNLPLHDNVKDFDLDSNNLKARINYLKNATDIGEEKVKEALLYNSIAAFALIDNLNSIEYKFKDKSYELKRKDIEAIYGNLDELLNDDVWKKKVQENINNAEYVNSFYKVKS